MLDGKSSRAPRIVCVGSNEESRIALQGLIKARVPIVAVVTRPANESAFVCDYANLHAICLQAGIPTIDTVDINAPATLAAVRHREPDYIYALGWSQLFGAELLKIPGQYCVGSHPAPLPRGRGRAPVPWTILQRQTRSAVSLFEMNAAADAGPLLMKKWFDVPPRAYAEDVYQRVAETLRDAFVELANAHQRGMRWEGVPQDGQVASFRAKRTPADGHIDFRAAAADVECLIRAVSRPYPGAYTYYRDRKLVIWQADCDRVPDFVGLPGQILLRDGKRVLVHAGDGPLWLADFSWEGQPCSAKELKIGTKMGYSVDDEIFRLKQEVRQLRALLMERTMDPSRIQAA